MPAKNRNVIRAQSYFPPAIYQLLEKRADANFSTVSREILKIVAKVLQEEEEQTKEAVSA